MKKLIHKGFIAFASMLVVAAAYAQTYPSKPVTILVPHAAGGANDAVARPFAQRMSSALNQPFVVENRAGAGGNIGTSSVVRAPKDGYTLLLTVGSSHTINPHIYKSPGFDPVGDFNPIALIATAPYVLVVNPSLPVQSVTDLIALAKSKPGEIYMASAGNGSLDHLLGEMFKKEAGVNLVHVPYKGAAAANTDLVAGQVSVTFTSWPSVMSFVKAGKLRLIAVASEKRSPLIPDVPTISESVPGVSAVSWYGLLTPKGTPSDVVTKLRSDVSKVLADPEFASTLIGQGAEVATLPPKEFGGLIQTDLAKWSEIVKLTGAEVN